MADRLPPRTDRSWPGRAAPRTGVAVAAIVLAFLVWRLAGPRQFLLPGVVNLLLAAVFTAFCALTGYGALSRLRGLALPERLVLGYGLALGVSVLGVFAFGLLGLMEGILAGAVVLLVLGGWSALRPLRRELTHRRTTPGAAARWQRVDWGLLGVIVVLAAALVAEAGRPCVDYDTLEYHAGVPAEWFRAGRIVELPHNVYSYFPMAGEMLTLGGMAVLGSAPAGAALGKLLAGSCTVWAAVALFCLGRRLFSVRAGLLAALLYLTVPWVVKVTVFGFVEDVQGFYTAAALLAFVTMVPRRGGAAEPASARSEMEGRASPWALAALCGAMVGMAISVKLTNVAFLLPAAGVAVMVVSLRGRWGWRPVAALAVGAVVLGAPFYLRNLILTGNPVFPVLSTHWGEAAGWSRQLAERFARFHSAGPVSLPALWRNLAGTAGQPVFKRPGFLAAEMVLLLVPLALVRRSYRRSALALLGWVVLVTALWFLLTHRIPRLLVPTWGPLALLAGAGADAFRGRGARAVMLGAVALHVVLASAVSVRMLRGRERYLAMLADAREAERDESGYQFAYHPDTAHHLWAYSPHAVRMINDLAAARQAAGRPTRVGLVGEAETLYFRPPVVYNTVMNRPWLADLQQRLAALPDARGADVRRAAGRFFRRRGVTHVYVNREEVRRFRGEGNYGWPAWLDRGWFDRLESAGVLRRLWSLGPQGTPAHTLYAVQSPGGSEARE